MNPKGTMDSIMSSLKMMPLQEYLLQGSILETHKDNLLHRLNGLCDTGTVQQQFIGPERFCDHEMVLHIRPTVHGAQPNVQPMSFRVRRSLEHRDAPWHLRYIGQPDIGDKSRHTLVRSCIDVGTSDNVVKFLQEMGFRLDFEFVVKGYLFRKGRMKVTVSEIYRMLQPGNVEQVERLSGSCLVELSVVAAQGQDQIQEDMKNFAEQLKPLVQLEKIDHRRLQQQMAS